MKQNITLSMDKDLLRKARVIAAQRQMSVSQMLGRELQAIIDDAERYELAKKKALANLRSGFDLGGCRPVSREGGLDCRGSRQGKS